VIVPEKGAPIKAWTKGVQLEDQARQQLLNVAQLPFIFKWVAAMPDVHWVLARRSAAFIPTKGAIIPAAVGVDIGCGMMAVQTDLNARPAGQSEGHSHRHRDGLPHGRTNHGGRGDVGAWNEIPVRNGEIWQTLKPRYDAILEKHPKLDRGNHSNHLALWERATTSSKCASTKRRTCGSCCTAFAGVGNRMGSYFIEIARKDMQKFFITLPDKDLAYFSEGTEHFNDYVEAVEWAQDFARLNRHLMMEQIVGAVRASGELRPFVAELKAINCHHNYVARERHYRQNILVTRKGAVRAREGDMGIIPGSMGARSYIVRGRGNMESFMSCSHGAGRAMSREKPSVVSRLRITCA